MAGSYHIRHHSFRPHHSKPLIFSLLSLSTKWEHLGIFLPPEILQVCSHSYQLWKSQWLVDGWVIIGMVVKLKMYSVIWESFFPTPSIVWRQWIKEWKRLLVFYMRWAGIFSNKPNWNFQVLQTVSVQRLASPTDSSNGKPLGMLWKDMWNSRVI